jgi:hypothetical protein
MKATLAPARLSRLTGNPRDPGVASNTNLIVRWGAVDSKTMAAVEDRLRILLRL